MRCPSPTLALSAVQWIAVTSQAQYEGDHITGFVGLQSARQAPPGLYVGNVVWVYSPSTLKDSDGNSIKLDGGLDA